MSTKNSFSLVRFVLVCAAAHSYFLLVASAREITGSTGTVQQTAGFTSAPAAVDHSLKDAYFRAVHLDASGFVPSSYGVYPLLGKNGQVVALSDYSFGVYLWENGELKQSAIPGDAILKPLDIRDDGVILTQEIRLRPHLDYAYSLMHFENGGSLVRNPVIGFSTFQDIADATIDDNAVVHGSNRWLKGPIRFGSDGRLLIARTDFTSAGYDSFVSSMSWLDSTTNSIELIHSAAQPWGYTYVYGPFGNSPYPEPQKVKFAPTGVVAGPKPASPGTPIDHLPIAIYSSSGTTVYPTSDPYDTPFVGAINQYGQVAGGIYPEGEATRCKALVLEKGAIQQLDSEKFSWTTDINKYGQVVGGSSAVDIYDSNAVLWENGSRVNLNSRLLSPLPDGDELKVAFAINDQGNILAYGPYNALYELFPIPALSIIRDKDNDNLVDETDPVATYARVGHWGADRSDGGVTGYDVGVSVETVGNITFDDSKPLTDPSSNFISHDPERFFVRVADPARNTDPGTIEKITTEVSIGTLLDSGTPDDDMTPITLTETGPNTGIFISDSQLLVSEDMLAESDDSFSSYPAFPHDDQPNDRTHRATVDGFVQIWRVTSTGTSICKIPVCNRSPDERKVINVVTHNFYEPWKDLNGNGTRDSDEPFVDASEGATAYGLSGVWGPIWKDADIENELRGLRAGLASARIRVNVVKLPAKIAVPTLFAEANPGPANGAAGLFDVYEDNYLQSSDGKFYASRDLLSILAYRSDQQYNAITTDDVVDIYFVPKFADDIPGQFILGAAVTTRYVTNSAPSYVSLPAQLNNQIFVSLKTTQGIDDMTLAHEMYHMLTQDLDYSGSTVIESMLFPYRPGPYTSTRSGRRVQESTVERARHQRVGSPANFGNLLLRNP